MLLESIEDVIKNLNVGCFESRDEMSYSVYRYGLFQTVPMRISKNRMTSFAKIEWTNQKTEQ